MQGLRDSNPRPTVLETDLASSGSHLAKPIRLALRLLRASARASRPPKRRGHSLPGSSKSGESRADCGGEAEGESVCGGFPRSFDPCGTVGARLKGPVEPKSRAGERAVPIPTVLREHLIAHKLASGRTEGLAFGRDPERPFNDSAVRRRAQTAWRRKRRARAAELAQAAGYEYVELDDASRDRVLEKAGFEPIAWHECRHTFASLMIAAGVNAKALSTYMGHSSITITLDRCGHLFPGNEDEAAGLLDAYLGLANPQGRKALGAARSPGRSSAA
jgi:hypothetical protein